MNGTIRKVAKSKYTYIDAYGDSWLISTLKITGIKFWTGESLRKSYRENSKKLLIKAIDENATERLSHVDVVNEVKRTYSVSVLRTAYAWHTFDVVAENESKAREIALENSGDYEYSEKDADYSVEEIELK